MTKFYAVSEPFIGEIMEFNTEQERDAWINEIDTDDIDDDFELDINRKAITKREYNKLFGEYPARSVKRDNCTIWISSALQMALLKELCNNG